VAGASNIAQGEAPGSRARAVASQGGGQHPLRGGMPRGAIQYLAPCISRLNIFVAGSEAPAIMPLPSIPPISSIPPLPICLPGRPPQPWVVKVGGDDGELRPWHYIYAFSIEKRLIMSSFLSLLPQSGLRTILKLTLWVCGTHPSFLE